MSFDPFGGAGGGFTPNAAQKAAINSGITAEKTEAINIKTGYIPPEPLPPEPHEEIVVDITDQVQWVMGTADKTGRGYVATNYDLSVNPWVYVDYAWVTGSEVISINTDEDNGYDYIETSFPSFKGSSNIPEFFLVFLSDLPEGYSDAPGANPGWPLSAAGASNRMNQYITGYVKNSFDDSRPYKTGKVENMRIPVPAGTKYVKACWYTETGLSSIVTWDGPEPTINDFYIRKVKSGTYKDISSDFTWYKGGMTKGAYYFVKTDTAVFKESKPVKIQDSDNQYQKLSLTMPRYTANGGGPTSYRFVFMTDLPSNYNDTAWDTTTEPGSATTNEQYLIKTADYQIRTAPSALGNGYGAVEEIELNIPSNARYIKAIWFADDFANWEGKGEIEFSCILEKEIAILPFPKQIIDTQVYYDAMNNEATTLDDGHVSTLKDTRFVVVLPKNYSHTGTPSKVLMICHGGTGEVRADGYWYPGDQADMYDTIDMFRENEYVIFDVDRDTNSANQCYGSPVMLEAYYNAFKYIRENYNVEDKLNIYAMSMGTNTAFNFVNLYRPLVKSILITGPRTGVAFDDFTNMSAGTLENFGATAVNIETKFYPFNILGQIITLDDNGSTILSLTRNVPPTKIIALESDKDNTQWTEGYEDVADALYNAGNFVVKRTVDTTLTHAQLCHLSDENLRREAIDWFNKYGK